MVKRPGIVALVLVLALTIAVPAALARGASHAMFEGSVWVEPVGDGNALDLDQIEFHAVEGHDGEPDTGYVVWHSSASPPSVHHGDIVFAQFTGRSPCDRLWLGDPEDPDDGLCALAMGPYSGPIDGADILAIVVCKETPYGGADRIVLVLMGDDYYAEYEFGVEAGDYSIHLPAGMFWADVAVDPWEDDYPFDFDHIVLHAREGRGNQPGTGYFFATDGETDHSVELDDVRTTGETPTGLPLGVYVEGWGVCAFASGHYSGPIEDANFVCMLVCKETPSAVDTILLVPSVDRDEGPILGYYFFDVVDGNLVIIADFTEVEATSIYLPLILAGRSSGGMAPSDVSRDFGRLRSWAIR